MTATTHTLLSLGHGYSAQALTRRLCQSSKETWQIVGTTRSEHKIGALEQSGITPMLWPEQKVDLINALEHADHILISAAPSQDHGDPFFKRLQSAISARHAKRPFHWIGYLSTTGVYGNHDGAWVDEKTPLTPSTQRGKLRMLAEAGWASLDGLPLHIFRLAGIYGPGRGPFSKVRAQTSRRIIKDNQVFSRIHVEDIAQALHASLNTPHPDASKRPAVYNLCDDEPAPPEDVIAYAAQLLSLPIPKAEPFEGADMSAMARSFYAESKRVSNQRLKDELGISLIYPNYKIGLQALLQGEE